MCQLLGMQANSPTDFRFSWRGFKERGGNTDKHVDGWGIAFYEGRGCRCFIDTQPSSSSPIAHFIMEYPIKSTNAIAHVRLATKGEVRLENVHPFTRELWGEYWIFGHNGDIKATSPEAIGKLELSRQRSGEGSLRYRAVGDTDSEAAFCYILNALMEKFPEKPPCQSLVYMTIKELWHELCDTEGTIFNFLLSNGEWLFAGCYPGSRPGSVVWNSLYYTVREFPFARVTLADCDYSIDFSQANSPKDRIAIVASAPLTTNEVWHEIARGQLIAFNHGVPCRHEQELECYLNFCSNNINNNGSSSLFHRKDSGVGGGGVGKQRSGSITEMLEKEMQQLTSPYMTPYNSPMRTSTSSRKRSTLTSHGSSSSLTSLTSAAGKSYILTPTAEGAIG